MFDVLVAALKCPNCNSDVPSTANTGMQTYLRSFPDGTALGIGFVFDVRDVTTESILRSGYVLITEPRGGQPICLLDTWTCPVCETEQWALMTISERRLQSIEAVMLDRATLERANFISEVNADILAGSFAADGPNGDLPT